MRRVGMPRRAAKLYASARKLFERNGFQFMCRMPDYYYPGEGKLLYLRVLSS